MNNAAASVSTYTASVYVRPGYTGASMAAASIEQALDKAHEHGELLLSNDEKRELYHVEISVRCTRCNGTGRVLKPRCRKSTCECAECGGYGHATIAEFMKRR